MNLNQIMEIMLKLSQTVLTPIIAILAAWIAFQQHKTNRYKLRLDLYDKRFNVFHKLISFVSSAVQQGNVTDEQLNEFLRSTAYANFLFDKDIETYIDEMYHKGVDLHYMEKSIKELSGNKQKEILDKREIVFNWFVKQFTESRKKFGRYLNFHRI